MYVCSTYYALIYRLKENESEVRKKCHGYIQYADLKKKVFSLDLNVRVQVSVRRLRGSWFQTCSEEKLKERSAVFVLTMCLERRCCEEERKSRVGLCMLTMSARYLGCLVDIILCVMRATLYWMRSLIGSQWSLFRTGWMWSRRLVPVTTRAIEFWTTCNFLRFLAEVPVSSELQ